MRFVRLSTVVAIALFVLLLGTALDYAQDQALLLQSLKPCWSMPFAFQGSDVLTTSIYADIYGNIYATREFRKGKIYYAYVAKASPAGRLVWQAHFGAGHYNCAYGICVDGAGNAFVTGITGNTVRGALKTSCLTIKYDPQGKALWKKTFSSGGPVQEQPFRVVADSKGNVYVASWSYEEYLGQADELEFSRSSLRVVKYDPEGNELWNNTYGGLVRPVDMVVDSKDNIYVLCAQVKQGDKGLVVVYDSTGKVAGNFSMENRVGLSGMVVDDQGHLYYGPRKYSAEGEVLEDHSTGAGSQEFFAFKDSRGEPYCVEYAAGNEEALGKFHIKKFGGAGDMGWSVAMPDGNFAKLPSPFAVSMGKQGSMQFYFIQAEALANPEDGQKFSLACYAVDCPAAAVRP